MLESETDIRGAVFAFMASSGHQRDYDSIKTLYMEVCC